MNVEKREEISRDRRGSVNIASENLLEDYRTRVALVEFVV